ncbi:hypothetical protein chiPu_0020030, partial [Chiloscyllium punctatum]|nr:hypothetical protein [Chiloscyllium punctatum]
LKGLDNLYQSFTPSQWKDIYKFCKKVLNSRPTLSGLPCASNTTGIRDWLLKNFYQFKSQIPFTDLLHLNKNVPVFELLDLLSAPQLSGLTVKSLNNASDINMIIDILRNKNFTDLIAYITQFIEDTRQMNITSIPQTGVRDALLNGIMRLLGPQFVRFNTTDYAEWFQKRLQLLLPSITAEELDSIPTNISCESFRAILKGLDNLYLNFTLTQNHGIYAFGKKFLNFQLSLSGSLGIACVDNTNGTREWIIKNFFQFMAQFKYRDFIILNKDFSGFEVLDLLSPQQLAELTVTSALNDTEKINQILNTLASRRFSDLNKYMTQFNREAEEANITVIENARVQHIMLSRIMKLLEPQFPTFNTIDYIDWFQTKLCLLLPSITKNELDIIPFNITCKAYQSIVKELNKLYSHFSMEQQRNISAFIVDYLSAQLVSTETACTARTNGSKAWLQINFGRFHSFVSYNILRALNKNFIGTDALESLSVSQLGELAGNGTLRNSNDVQRIFRIINNGTIVEFIDAFSTAVNKSKVVFSPGVRTALLREVLNLIEPILSNGNVSELYLWFGIRLQALLPGLNEMMVPSLFVTESCNGSQVIISVLSSIKQQLDAAVQEAIYRNILTFNNVSPLRCYGNNSFVDYLNNRFQNFSEFLTLEDTIQQIPRSQLAEVLKTIDPSGLADLLNRPRFIDNNKILITVLNTYGSVQNLVTFIDVFNQKVQDNRLTDDNRVALLEVFWYRFVTALSENNGTDVDEWLNVRLQPYLLFITTDLLASNITLKIPCFPYRKIVRTLNTLYSNITSSKQREIYNGIKIYLQQEPKPKCYNASDPVLNSTAWFVDYLGLFMNEISLTDLRSFFDDETQLQEFVANPENQALFRKLMLSTEITKFFIDLLLKNNSLVNATSLPDSLVCFILGTDALKSLNEQQILAIIRKVNDVCRLTSPFNKTGDGSFLSDEERKLAIFLVSKFDNFSLSILNSLGQTAVGLSLSQIRGIDANILQEALPNLGQVKGWNLGQAKAIITKLLKNGFQVNDKESLLKLGSLVAGIPSDEFQSINPGLFINLISNPTFVENIGAAPQPIQTICVLQVLRNVEDPVQTVKTIPSVLAKEVPPVLLNSNLGLSDVNDKQWVPSQAAVYFESVVKSSNNYDTFSPSVLQGFSCGAVKDLNFTNFLQLVQAMKGKGAMLDESQLSCMFFRLTSKGKPPAIETLPVDVLLYFNSKNFRTSRNCKTFFKGVGKSNINLLRKGSLRRQNLLEDAKICLGVTGANLTKESIAILGGLVCDLEGSVIKESDLFILEALKNCISYEGSQKKAIETLLQSGASIYGSPSSWSSSTIEDLGNLPLAFTEIWNQVNRDILIQALPRFIKKVKTFISPNETLAFINQLNLRDSNEGANCTMLAAEAIDDLTPAFYDASMLDVCLSDLVLEDNVFQLGAFAFDPAQLVILKKRLLQIYPNGLPENQIQLLGNISTVFSVADVSLWNITEVVTLSALMMQKLESPKVKAIIERYLQLGGVLNAVSVQAIGGPNLCLLNESLLVTISNLTDAGALDLSTCMQSQKNLLYNQASSALRSQQSNPIPYFHLLSPYIGGIPQDDLEILANNSVNMDFATFISLNPQEVKNLSAQNLIDLLGYNLPALQRGINETVVRVWVNSHLQSEVQKLGLTGGIPDPTLESIFCADKDSSAVNNFLIEVKRNQICNFNIVEYACSQTDLLKIQVDSEVLSSIFDCFTGPKVLNTSDEIALTVFLQKFEETTRNEALDKFNNRTQNTSSIPLMTKITFMNALWEIVKTNENLTNADFLRKWFQERFRPFIAGISQSVLNGFLMRNITCDGFQVIVQGLSYGLREMPPETRMTVLQEGVLNFLNTTAFSLNCYNKDSFLRFLKKSFPKFASFLTLKDVFNLAPPGIVNELVNSIDPRETARALSRPGFINDNRLLTIVLIHIEPTKNLAAFIDQFIIETQDSDLLADVIKGLEREFSRSLSGIDDLNVKEWISTVLVPALPEITSTVFNSNNSIEISCFAFEKIISPSELADLLSKPGFIDDFEILTNILINIHSIQDLNLFVGEFITKIPNIDTLTPVIIGLQSEVLKSLSGLSEIDVKEWLNETLIPSLPLIVETVLTSSISLKIPCSTFREIVSALSYAKDLLSKSDQELIYRKLLLRAKVSTAMCFANTSFILFLKDYFQGFSNFLTLSDAYSLIPPGREREVLDSINPRNLADVLSTPGFIDSSVILVRVLIHFQSVDKLVILIDQFFKNIQDSEYFDDVVEELQKEFYRSMSGVSDIDVDVWLNNTLIPSLPLITKTVLASNDSRRFPCPLFKRIVDLLSYFKDRLKIRDQQAVYKNLLTYHKAFPLYCYNNSSFLLFLETYFQGYVVFLTLKDVSSLVPPDRVAEVLSTIAPSELADRLRIPGFINDNRTLTIVLLNIKPIQNLAAFIDAFTNATQDSNIISAIIAGLWPQFTENLPELSDAEVDTWLNTRLVPYLPFITTRLLVSNSTLRIPCLTYRKIINTLNTLYTRLNAEQRTEIYKGIRTYLQQGPKPKCYNVNDPVLNSTAWFAEYLGLYLAQMSLTDLQSFSDDAAVLREFAANEENLALLENLALINEVSKVYINFLVEHNPNFNASRYESDDLAFE